MSLGIVADLRLRTR